MVEREVPVSLTDTPSAGAPIRHQEPADLDISSLPRSPAGMTHQEAAAGVGEAITAARAESPLAIAVVTRRPQLGDRPAQVVPPPLLQTAFDPLAGTPPWQPATRDTSGPPSPIKSKTSSPTTSPPPQSAGEMSNQPLPASMGGSATNPLVEAPTRDAAPAIVVVPPWPQPGTAPVQAVVTAVIEPPFIPSEGSTVNAGPNGRTSPQLGARAGQPSQSTSAGGSAVTDGSAAVTPRGANSSEQASTDPDVPPPPVRTEGRAPTDHEAAAQGGRSVTTESGGPGHEDRPSPKRGARQGRASQSSSAGGSADEDDSTEVNSKGTSSSEQGPTDPVVRPPRGLPGKRANTGKNRAGKGGATKPGASGFKGGTPRQLGTQKGRKKGRQGSSSSRDGDVNRGDSASSGSTPQAAPKFRCVRPR